MKKKVEIPQFFPFKKKAEALKFFDEPEQKRTDSGNYRAALVYQATVNESGRSDRPRRDVATRFQTKHFLVEIQGGVDENDVVVVERKPFGNEIVHQAPKHGNDIDQVTRCHLAQKRRRLFRLFSKLVLSELDSVRKSSTIRKIIGN